MGRGFRKEHVEGRGGNFSHGRLVLALRRDIDAPCLVYCRGREGNCSGTFEDAIDSGEVDGYELTDEELTWLETYRERVEGWLEYCIANDVQGELAPRYYGRGRM